MFPPQQLTGHGLSSPGTPRVSPTLAGNSPVIWLTSPTSTALEQLHGTHWRPPINLPIERFQPAVELLKIDAAGNANLPPLTEMSYDEDVADCECEDLSDLGSAKGQALISLKQMAFSLKQFGKRMGQYNISTFNKWKRVWVAGFRWKKHQSIIRGQNYLKPLRDGPLHWMMVIADYLETFLASLALEKFHSAKWMQRQWVKMHSKQPASVVRQARKKARRGNKRQAIHLAERVGKQTTSNLPELPNTTFMVVIRRVLNVNNNQTSRNRLQALYTDVRHWEELIDSIERNCSPKQPYCPTALSMCNVMQE